MSTIVLPASLAAIIITARALTAGTHRMPYPYEYGSMAVIYGGAGLLSEVSGELGAAIAWGYLVALLLAPSSSDLLGLVGGNLKAPPGATGGVQNPQPNQGGAA
jgi:hypothetical protein